MRRILILGFLLLAGAGGGFVWWIHWEKTGPIEPSGGLLFPVERVIDVPGFLQADKQWASDPLGPGPGTLGGEGCAVASAAMVMAFYGADVDPGRLNRFVRETGGFTPQGWLYWEAAAEYPGASAEKAYEDAPSYSLIDQNLLRGNPVIVRIRFPSGMTHFVVIVGKRGFDYLIRDPGSPGERGVYALKDYGLPIEALRFYRKRTPFK